MKPRGGASRQGRCCVSRCSLALLLALACLLPGPLVCPALAGRAGIFVSPEAFLRVKDPDRNIPPNRPGAKSPQDIDPRHLTLGPFGPTDKHGAGGLYITAEGIDSTRVPELFGPATLLLPSLDEMHTEGWCYRSDRLDDQTGILLLYGVEYPLETLAVFADRRIIRGSDQCARTSRVHAGLATLSGLRLGLTHEQVRAILGPPQSSDSWRYGYRSERWGMVTPELRRKLHWEDNKGTHHTRIQQVVVWFNNGKVVGFAAEQFTTDGPTPEPAKPEESAKP